MREGHQLVIGAAQPSAKIETREFRNERERDGMVQCHEDSWRVAPDLRKGRANRRERATTVHPTSAVSIIGRRFVPRQRAEGQFPKSSHTAPPRRGGLLAEIT